MRLMVGSKFGLASLLDAAWWRDYHLCLKVRTWNQGLKAQTHPVKDCLISNPVTFIPLALRIGVRVKWRLRNLIQIAVPYSADRCASVAIILTCEQYKHLLLEADSTPELMYGNHKPSRCDRITPVVL